MNKKIKLVAIALMASVSIAIAQTASPEWAEFKTFHTYMSTTFHPAEEGDFAPLKSKSDSLFIAAKKWQASPVPSNYQPAETRAALAKLVTQCDEINKAVKKKATDKQLNTLITGAHDIFHTIVGECRKEE